MSCCSSVVLSVVMQETKLLTVGQVAERLQVSEYTVRRWLNSDRLKGLKLGGDRLGWRVSEDELRRFLEGGAP